jgi:hypothetical protein
MKRLTLSLLAAFLICCTSAASAGTLRLIAVADVEDEKIGPWAGTDLSLVMSIFTEGVATHELDITILAGQENFSEDAILQTVRNLNAAPDDAVVVYFSGHGAYDENGHFLDVSGQRLYRSTLLDAIATSKCRLQVLLTDACFNERIVRPEVMAATKAGPQVTTPLFRSLFFESSGVLDLNSCRRDQRAFVRNDYREGAVFTATFVQLLKRNLRNDLQWPQFLADARRQTNLDFRRYVANKLGQGSQDLEEFTNTIRRGGSPDSETITNARLGVDVEFSEGEVVILTARDGGAARKLKLAGDDRRWVLDPGDIIRSINGSPVETLDDFTAAVRQSPRTMSLEVWSKLDGKTYEFTAQLQ